jgi:hypothetical protein
MISPRLISFFFFARCRDWTYVSNLFWHFFFFDCLIFVCLCIWRRKKKFMFYISMREKIIVSIIIHLYACHHIHIVSSLKCYTYLTFIVMISFMAIIAEYWSRWKMNEQVYYRMYWDIILNDAYIETIIDLYRICESGGGVSYCSSIFRSIYSSSYITCLSFDCSYNYIVKSVMYYVLVYISFSRPLPFLSHTNLSHRFKLLTLTQMNIII